jgi:hypothetical protein
MYTLTAIIEGKPRPQGEYTTLNAVLGRIRKLDLEYLGLGLERPTEYKITVIE